MRARGTCTGFTLIEVLVALVIVAFGMGALLATLSSSADTTGYLRDKSFAEWIALNRLSQVRLSRTAPTVGSTEGDVDYAGGKWHWTQQVGDPGIAGILRIDVSVRHSTGEVAKASDAPSLASATGFFGLAVAQSSGIDPDWSLWSLGNSPAAAVTVPAETSTTTLTPAATTPGTTPNSPAVPGR